jgi:hypothetical protein
MAKFSVKVMPVLSGQAKKTGDETDREAIMNKPGRVWFLDQSHPGKVGVR